MLIRLSTPHGGNPVYVRAESVEAIVSSPRASQNVRATIYLATHKVEAAEEAEDIAVLVRKAEEATVVRAQFTPGVGE